jgi:chemotaxis protein histidine kinase CheA
MPSPELLRFFHAEAGEYLDAIEGLLRAGGGAPDAGAFVAAARALRGSATMARVPRVADLALVLERIANGLRDGDVAWSPELLRDLTDAAQDLRSLVRAASTWSSGDESRAAQRLAALRRHLPNEAPTPVRLTPPGSTAPIFIALQASAIASDLEHFLTRSDDKLLVDDVVSRLRSLRGIAGIGDHAPLGDVADAVERALRELAPDTVLVERDSELLGTAAAVFRRASADLRSRGRFDAACPEVERFARVAVASEAAARPEPIGRIDDLLRTDDGTEPASPVTASGPERDDRFREEFAARAEHLARLVADARAAGDPFSRERARRDLREYLTSLATAARSFGAEQVAAYFDNAARDENLLDPAILEALEYGAGVVGTAEMSVPDMEQRLAVLERRRLATPASAATLAPAGAAVLQGTGGPDAGREARGAALHSLLAHSLAGFQSLDATPLSEPAPLEEDVIVPIETLEYRGRSALARAIELRDELRARGEADPVALQELYALLDLAQAE